MLGRVATSLDTHRVQRIALGLALAAFVAVTIALIVVATRGGSDGSGRLTLGEHQVSADDLAQIRQHATFSTSGFAVTDPALATRLGLGPDDRVIDVFGAPVHTAFAFHEVLKFARGRGATALYVTIESHDARKTMRWTFDEPIPLDSAMNDLGPTASSLPSYPPPPPPPIPPSVDPADPLAAQLNQIEHSDDTHYTVPRSLVDAVLANPMGVAKGARIVPAVKNGKPDGFKLYSIRRTSIYALLGFRNGDTLVAINGMELTSPDKALEIYTKLKDTTELSIDIERRFQPMTLTIKIR